MGDKLSDVCGQLLSTFAITDDSIWVLDGDLADSDGAMHFATSHPDRFIMSGIAEQSMVSLAAGMATCGLRPWVFSFAAFLCCRAYDQIRQCISQTKLPVTLVGANAGGLSGRNGKTHTILNDVAIMASLPNIDVWAPADANDLAHTMSQIFLRGNPSYIRLPRESYDSLSLIQADYQWLGPPSKIAIVSTGYGTRVAIQVRDRLAARSISSEVLHIAKLSPFPRRIHEALLRKDFVFVIEDHCALGGLCSILANANVQVSAPTFAWPTLWSGQSGDAEAVMSATGWNSKHIAREIADSLGG